MVLFSGLRGITGVVLVFFIAMGTIGGCGGSGSNTGNNGAPKIVFSFQDVTSLAGFNYSHGYISGQPQGEFQLIAGGVAAGDYDNDGWIDLYAIRGDIGPNLLFRNLGNGTFAEVGANAGVDLNGILGSGPLFWDYDGDGYLDLFVGGLNSNAVTLFRNIKNGKFEVVENNAGLAITRAITMSAACGDYDNDNDIDLFAAHWGSGAVTGGTSSEHLWMNNGNSTFTDVSVSSGITASYTGFIDFTFTPNFTDINNDGFKDILIASDFGTSAVFTNQGNGTFQDTTTIVISDENGMGGAVGDYDNDGDMDWFVSSILDEDGVSEGNWGITGNRLYRNDGGAFSDVTEQSGVRHGYWGWGSCFADFDNDGYLDIAHVNGFGFPPDGGIAGDYFADPTRLFMSNGNGTFTEKAFDLGLIETGQGRGIVCFDYDKDGDIDMFIANNDQPPSLFRNNGGNQNNYISITLNGMAPNTQGIGALIEVTTGGTTQTREVRCGSNFVSQDPALAHFGLGESIGIDTLKVNWPDGQTTTLQNVAPNQYLVIDHPGVL